MKIRALVRLSITAISASLAAQIVTAQSNSSMAARGNQPPAIVDSEQTAHILGFDTLLKKLATLQTERLCGSPPSLEELAIRQQLLEAVQTAALDVDSVLGEISNEEGELSNLRTSLQGRRDSTVAKLNAAALITGSTAGAAVSATQFNTLGSRANNVGDGFGIGAGVASTIFSIMATRKQNGPNGALGEVPNMLAPLFDRSPVLNTYYPSAVMQYLQTVPIKEDPSRGTRLEQLKAQWVQSGRLDTSDSGRRQREVTTMTSSSDPSVKVSIQDLSNRIAMLVDVSGRVSLMKRDLAVIMRTYLPKPTQCPNQ